MQRLLCTRLASHFQKKAVPGFGPGAVAVPCFLQRQTQPLHSSVRLLCKPVQTPAPAAGADEPKLNIQGETSSNAESAQPNAEDAAAAEPTQEDKLMMQLEELQERNLELEAESSKWKDEMMRSLADAENTRKRAEREIQIAKKYGVQGFAKTMLDVSDNLSRSLQSVPAEVRTEAAEHSQLRGFYEGVELTAKILSGSFEKHGVSQFDPMGQEFDPNTMMALYEVPLSDDLQGGHVAQVVKTGFMLHDRVIRPAEVGVVKKS